MSGSGILSGLAGLGAAGGAALAGANLGAGVGAYVSLIPGSSLLGLGALAEDFQIEIGDFTLQNFEEPSKITGGSSQALKEHVYPGGVRTIDTYGADPKAPVLMGRMMGPDAETRINMLETIVQQGLPVNFTYSQHSYQVVLEDLEWNFYNYYDIDYTLTIRVIVDQGLTLPGTLEADLYSVMSEDVSWVQSSISGLLGGLF
jgi:hypothetical protein